MSGGPGVSSGPEVSGTPAPDVVVAGAGIIGCAVALELAGRGARVAVVDPGVPGMEATWAAGGMLSPLGEAPGAGPFLRLGRASLARYPGWVAGLVESSGVPVEYRRHGKLEVALDDEVEELLRTSLAWRRGEGARAE
ncbi:MAG TPA: FAD-dependent oxidoreductase, partial [Longimicrobiales bacterium]|nr:FAD-dependent oxidoreductase [Longimicrobiales bacterium]